MAGSAGGITTGFDMVNQPNAPIASATGSGLAVPMNAPTLGFRADSTGAQMPSAGMRGGPSNTLAQPAQQSSMFQASNMGPDTMPQGSFTPSAGILGGPSITMPNGMSSGDVQMGGAVQDTMPAGALGGAMQTPASSLPVAMPAVLPNGAGARIPQQPADVFKSPANTGGPLVPMPSPVMGGGKGGGMTAIPRPTQGQFAPLAPQGGFNVNQAAAGALQQAMQGTQAAMGFQAPPTMAFGYAPTTQQVQGQQQAYGYTPAQQQLQGMQTGFGYDPAQRRGFTLAGRDISQYESPYQQAVIDRTLEDFSGAQEKALNVMGQQATAARAFGGSRQGIAEAETRKGFAEKAAEAVANLRERGFQQAMGAAQFDVGQLAGTEAANVAAQQAAQQFGATSAQAAQAANIARQQQIEAANVAAQTGAAQYGAGAKTAAEAANIQRAQQVAASNAAAQTAAAQYMAQQRQAAQQQNFANQLAALQARQGAAQQLAGLGQQAFGIGQTIQQQQAQQGLLQQGLQQALIDAARGQYAGYVGSPSAALQAPLAALGVTPVPQSTTTSSSPGLFNYLQAAAGMGFRPFG